MVQQALAYSAVGGRDTYRGVDGEAAAVLPSPHRLGVIAQQQAAAHEHAQRPPAHLPCTWAMAVASRPVAAWKATPHAA